jgi:hypothetical protein
MGRNWKEKAAYRYIHFDMPIPRHLFGIRMKWWRHNFDIGEMRYKRKQLIDKQLNKEIYE